MSIANGIPDDPETWDVFNVKTTGYWIIKTSKKEKDIVVKLTEKERDEMNELAGGSDERWLALMLMKEIKVIAEMILEKKEEEKDFWKAEENRRKTDIKKIDKRDALDLDDDDDDDDDDVDDYVDDYDY